MGCLGGKKRSKEITKLHLEEVNGHLHQEREKEKGEVSGPESSASQEEVGALRRRPTRVVTTAQHPRAPDPAGLQAQGGSADGL